jgi:HAD superfamily hydrolase (TIGR01509 family)
VRRIALAIFDCDGVLVDSEPIANRVLRERMAEIGLAMPLDQVMATFVGRTQAGCIARIEEMLGHAVPAGFAARWDAALFEAFARELQAVPGVGAAIASLPMPFCVASNSGRERMRACLEATGLLPRFEGRMFSAEEVPRPKPAPDLFLHAAREMGVAPPACAVIEDTVTGVRAAVAAGMTVFGYAAHPQPGAAALEAAGAKVFREMGDLAALLSSTEQESHGPPDRP